MPKIISFLAGIIFGPSYFVRSLVAVDWRDLLFIIGNMIAHSLQFLWICELRIGLEGPDGPRCLEGIRGRSQTTLTRFWLFFDPLPLCVVIFYGMKVDKKWIILDHLLTSSSKCSLWTTPNGYKYFYWHYDNLDSESESFELIRKAYFYCHSCTWLAITEVSKNGNPLVPKFCNKCAL